MNDGTPLIKVEFLHEVVCTKWNEARRRSDARWDLF